MATIHSFSIIYVMDQPTEGHNALDYSKNKLMVMCELWKTFFVELKQL